MRNITISVLTRSTKNKCLLMRQSLFLSMEVLSICFIYFSSSLPSTSNGQNINCNVFHQG